MITQIVVLAQILRPQKFLLKAWWVMKFCTNENFPAIYMVLWAAMHTVCFGTIMYVTDPLRII